MRRPHFRKGSFATVTAVTALVIAMGGTGYAASLITSKQIKNGTIKGVDIHAATIPSSKLAPGTIPAPYGGTSAYSTFHDAAVSIQNQVGGVDATVISLNVPAGSYVFDATTWLENGATPVLVRCTLAAGGDSDLKRPLLEANGGGAASSQSVALQVVHTFAAPGTAKLMCWSFGAATTVNNTKLTAIAVDHLSNVAG